MGVYVYTLCSKSEAKRVKIKNFNAPKESLIAYFKYAFKLSWSILGGHESNEKAFKKLISNFKRSWSGSAPNYIIYENALYEVNKEKFNDCIKNFEILCYDDGGPMLKNVIGNDKMLKKIARVIQLNQEDPTLYVISDN